MRYVLFLLRFSFLSPFLFPSSFRLHFSLSCTWMLRVKFMVIIVFCISFILYPEQCHKAELNAKATVDPPIDSWCCDSRLKKRCIGEKWFFKVGNHSRNIFWTILKSIIENQEILKRNPKFIFDCLLFAAYLFILTFCSIEDSIRMEYNL